MSLDRAFELLSAAADDDLTRTEQEELQELLRESAEARQLQRELRDMDKLLTDLPQMDPPIELRDEIMQRVPFRPRTSDTQAAGGGWLPAWLKIEWAPLLRYGVSTAFGALLVIAVYESRPDYGRMTDITELVGTMAPEAGEQREMLDRFSFDRTGIASIAKLEQTDDALILDIRIDTDRPVEVAIDFAAANADFGALAQSNNQIETIQFTEQVLRVKGRGQRRFAVLLRKRNGEPSAESTQINLEYSSNGELVQQGMLSSIP